MIFSENILMKLSKNNMGLKVRNLYEAIKNDETVQSSLDDCSYFSLGSTFQLEIRSKDCDPRYGHTGITFTEVYNPEYVVNGFYRWSTTKDKGFLSFLETGLRLEDQLEKGVLHKIRYDPYRMSSFVNDSCNRYLKDKSIVIPLHRDDIKNMEFYEGRRIVIPLKSDPVLSKYDLYITDK